MQRNEHPQHRWMNWKSLRRTQRYQLKRQLYKNPVLVMESKRFNIEAIRRVEAEAENALKRERLLEERRAAKRPSATPMDELETIIDDRS